MNDSVVSGQFVDGPSGPLFVLSRRPLCSERGSVLAVPPFAEEMNKSRRMVTTLAMAVAASGLTVVVPDLYGTGDSAGDFADASIDAWNADLQRVCEWCEERGTPVTDLLAIRLGAALAVGAIEAGRVPACRTTVLWQPVFDGSRYLTQFLRLRVAAALMVDDRTENVAGLRASLASGSIVEVAGYPLSGQLARGLDALVPPPGLPRALGSVHWMEVVRAAGGRLPQSSQELINRSRSAGVGVTAQVFEGEPFWSTTEIVSIPAMAAASAAALGHVA